MRLFKQLERWKIRKQINQSIIDVIFRLRNRLAHYWQADVNTPQIGFYACYIACSLGRIERGGCVSPLYSKCSKKCKVRSFSTSFSYSSRFTQVNAIFHSEAEQTYF